MTRFLKVVFALSAFATCLFSMQIVERIPRSTSITVPRVGGYAQANLRELGLTITYPSGKTARAEILMLHDPETGLFWWRYLGVEPGGGSHLVQRPIPDSVLYITDDKVVGFSYSTPNLWVRESTEHFPTIEAGQASVLAELKNRGKQLEEGTSSWFVPINVASSLGPEFLHLKGSASSFPEPKLQQVTRKEGRWRLTLQGPNKDRVDLVLSDDYKIIDVVRLSSKAKSP